MNINMLPDWTWQTHTSFEGVQMKIKEIEDRTTVQLYK